MNPGESPKNSVRVAFFTGNYNHIPDGVSRTLNRVVGFLEQKQVPVLVFGPTVDNPPMQHAGELVAVPSIPIPGRGEYQMSLGLPGKQRRQLEEFAPTIVHVATPDLLGRKALNWGIKHGIPVVATYHTHFSSYLKYYRLHALEQGLWRYLRRFYSKCAEVYVPSQSMIDVLEEQGISGNLKLWERGVETHRFHPRNRNLDWRRKYGIGDEEIVICYVSRLVWEKAPDVYANVLSALTDQEYPVRALVAGDGPAKDGLKAMLPGNAVFTGHLEGDELPKAYACSDIFLFPSDTETFGNVTLEAMASGIPTICADATGSRTLVKHGITGFLADSGNVETFTQVTKTLVQDTDLRTRMGQAARQAAEPYDWEEVLNRLLNYYHGVLQR